MMLCAMQGLCAGIGLGLVLLVGGHVWRPQPARAQDGPVVPEVMQAKRFEMVDDAGKVRAVLGMGEQGDEGLALMNARGVIRAALLLQEDSPRLSLADTTGRVRTSLLVQADNTPALGMTDAQGKRRVELAVGKDAATAFNICDASEKPRIGLSLHPDGGSYISLVD